MIHIYKQILKPCFLCLVLGLFSLIGCNSSQNGLNSNQGTGGMEKDLNANEKFYDDEEALNKAIEESLRIEEGEEEEDLKKAIELSLVLDNPEPEEEKKNETEPSKKTYGMYENPTPLKKSPSFLNGLNTFVLPPLKTGNGYAFLFHGMGMTSDFMNKTGIWFGKSLPKYSLHFVKGMEAEISLNEKFSIQALLVYSEICDVIEKDHTAEIIFLGHSLGGVISYLVIKQLREQLGKNVKSNFTIASPLEGAPVLRLKENKILCGVLKNSTDPVIKSCVNNTDAAKDLMPGSDALGEVVNIIKTTPWCSKLAVGISSDNTAEFTGIPSAFAFFLNPLICGDSKNVSNDGLLPLTSHLASNSKLGLENNFYTEICKGDLTHRDLNHPLIKTAVIKYIEKFGLNS